MLPIATKPKSVVVPLNGRKYKLSDPLGLRIRNFDNSGKLLSQPELVAYGRRSPLSGNEYGKALSLIRDQMKPIHKSLRRQFRSWRKLSNKMQDAGYSDMTIHGILADIEEELERRKEANFGAGWHFDNESLTDHVLRQSSVEAMRDLENRRNDDPSDPTTEDLQSSSTPTFELVLKHSQLLNMVNRAEAIKYAINDLQAQYKYRHGFLIVAKHHTAGGDDTDMYRELNRIMGWTA